MTEILIADSGSTKCEWALIKNGKKKTVFTQGLSPYFLTTEQIITILTVELMPNLKKANIDKVFFYGTGLGSPNNIKIVQKALKQLFATAAIEVNHDLLAAARALCGTEKGIACILGTGSNSCFYTGKRIAKNSPGLGYILGDEGSGSYLGKKVIQYFLYDTFDEDLRYRFNLKYETSANEILERVYKEPLPNRYLATFALFLAENRGHYMIENIIEDGLNDFFFAHIIKYNESWKYPIHFIGGIAYGFRDVVEQLCNSYELEMGQILQAPMSGLVKYHKQQVAITAK